MILAIEQLKRIAAGGGGFVLDASTLTFNQMRDIAVAAETGGAKITLKNVSGLTAVQLFDLATLAPGLIVFDQTSTQ